MYRMIRNIFLHLLYKKNISYSDGIPCLTEISVSYMPDSGWTGNFQLIWIKLSGWWKLVLWRNLVEIFFFFSVKLLSRLSEIYFLYEQPLTRFRSSHQQMSHKKAFLKTFGSFTGKHLGEKPYCNKVSG